MKNAIRKVLLSALVLALALSVVGGASAAAYPSKAFKLPKVSYRATEEPAAQPSDEPTAEPAEDDALDSEENASPEASVEPRQVIVVLSDGEVEIPLLAEADAGAEVLRMISGGAVLWATEIRADWTKLSHEGAEGFVPTAKIALYNEEILPEEEETVRAISVKSSLEGVTAIAEGTMVELTATLTGFDDVEYHLQWQYTPDEGATNIDIEGANGSSYSYAIDFENFRYMYRLVVTVTDPAGEAQLRE